jgi:hypothetical protein
MTVKLNYMMKTKTANIPGYTAEASLFNVSTRYQATAQASAYGGIVQPAQSDVFYPHRPVPFLSSSIPTRPLYCLKYNCVDLPNRGPFCWRVLGIWNPRTASCE